MEMFFLMLVIVGSGLVIYLIPQIIVAKLAKARQKRVRPLAMPRAYSATSPKSVVGSRNLEIPAFQRKGVQIQLSEAVALPDASDDQITPGEMKAQLDEIRFHLKALLEKKEEAPRQSRKGSKSQRKVNALEDIHDLISSSSQPQEPLFEVIS